MICKFKLLNSFKTIQRQLLKNNGQIINNLLLKQSQLKNTQLIQQQKNNTVRSQITNKNQSQINQIFRFNKFQYSLWKSKQKQTNYHSQYRKNIKNYQLFILQSQFHQKGNLIIKGQNIEQKLLKNIQIRYSFQPLCKVLQQLTIIRQKIDIKSIRRQAYAQHHQNTQYFQLYKRLNDELLNLLKQINQLEKKGVDVIQIKIDIMKVIGYYKCVQFNEYFLLKLLKLQMSFQETVSTINLVNQLKNQCFNINTQFHIQKHINNFYKTIVPNLLYKQCKFQQNSRKMQKSKINIMEAFQILSKIDKAFNQIQVYEKQKFVYNFTQNNFQQLKKQIQSKIHHEKKHKQVINSLVQIFKFYISSVNYDYQTIKLFQSMLIQSSQHLKNHINQQASRNLIDIYSKVSINSLKIYTIYIKPYLYHNLQSIQNITTALNFYTTSQCKDKALLSNCLTYLQYFYRQKNKLQTTPKNISRIHISLHYLKIKKQIKQNKFQFENQINNLCQKQNYNKNCQFMPQIINKAKNEKKIINQCISIIDIRNSYTSGFKQHKNSYFQAKACKIIKQFVQTYNANHQGQYQLKYIQNYKFCIYQLDFAIFQIGPNKQLLSLINLEIASLQYFSPKIKQQTILDSLQNGEIIPEKNGRLKRSKNIRQEILQHYGWQVVYLSNFIFKEKDQFTSSNKELNLQKENELNLKTAVQKQYFSKILSKRLKIMIN